MIPSLKTLVPLHYPQVVDPILSQGWQQILWPYQSYYLEHPRSFLTRFLMVLRRTFLVDRDFYYVLKLGTGQFLAVFSKHYEGRVRFTMERLLLEKQEEGYKTTFQEKTWTDMDGFLEALFSLLLSEPPVSVDNFFDNNFNQRYTPQQFLKKTQPIPFSTQQLQWRNRSQSRIRTHQKQQWKISDTIRNAETHFEHIFPLEKMDVVNWYESMQYSRRVKRRHKIRAEYYEPAAVYRR